MAQQANDPCTQTSNYSFVCSGNQAAGISLTNIQSLTVDRLTQAINSAGIGIYMRAAYGGATLSFFGANYSLVTPIAGPGVLNAVADGVVFDRLNSALTDAAVVQVYGEINVSGYGAAGVRLSASGVNGANGSNGGTLQQGGRGGDGTAGASATLSLAGSIQTSAARSYGVSIASTGGNGGNGGAGASTRAGGPGGDGAIGSASMTVNVLGPLSITTTQSGSIGLYAQLNGGSGGRGGTSNCGIGSCPTDGGNGAAAGTFRFNSNAITTITTAGDGAQGVLLGGQGGNGGTGGTQQLNLGGRGGQGGDGGGVLWTSAANVQLSTSGKDAPGIQISTLGGTGARGADASAVIGSKGGAGGAGGAGGFASAGAAFSSTNIVTRNDRSTGVQVESIGGNGGNGGNGRNGVFTEGGNGGAGGAGGVVTVGGQYVVSTSGAESDAIIAVSRGGDSGTAGSGSSLFGSGGGADAARGSGPVTVTITGSLTTLNTRSSGIEALSIGGGGGAASGSNGLVSDFVTAGGSAGGGGAVTVDNRATVVTLGDESAAIMALSIGGGGGDGGPNFAAFYATASSGGDGGNGGIVSVTNTGGAGDAGRLTTSGNDASGISAESIGGNGGNGGDTGALTSVGGNSAYGGNGGAVSVTNSASISTANSIGTAPPAALGGQVPVTTPICGTGCSPGIRAQSIGGGGGNSGSTFGLVSLGGSVTGGAGTGGSVVVNNSGAITTALADSDAIQAQSIGGSGGSAGGVIAAGVVGALAIGGNAGSGGDGGTVFVSTSAAGELVTKGTESHGIFAQSLGGGGGDAGYTVAASVGNYALSVAEGGNGGGAGNGAQVNVLTGANISTQGFDSAAIAAESEGGGGGDTGIVVAASAATTASASLAIGGNGGAGGSASVVSVSFLSTAPVQLTTRGAESPGVLALSEGGGGGNGEMVLAAGAAQNVSANLSLGAAGGVGGDGGDVNVDMVVVGSRISTIGHDSPAILALSEGGGGGHAGLTVSASAATVGAISFSMGASGGAAGEGKRVTVNNQAQVSTAGADSDGIVAQSEGGGGGRGSMSIAASVLATGDKGLTFNGSMGGAGGGGGGGGIVSLTNGGRIEVSGNGSKGLYAQSGGGGGGTGGVALAGSVLLSGGSATALQANFAMGGSGAQGGAGDLVTVTNTGAILTTGGTDTATPDMIEELTPKTAGIFAQSVGGGGGSGGMAGTLQLNLLPGISGTQVNLGIALGGSGGAGGAGGEVRVNNSGQIETRGAQAPGIFAQSVSNGGGDGGLALTLNLQPGQPADVATVNLNFALGGAAGNGQAGGAVSVVNSGDISTGSYAAAGIYAASIGGGGGNAGDADSVVFNVACVIKCGDADKDKASKQSKSLDVNIGGRGGAGNNGGSVSVQNSANVTTVGTASYAIEATSIGAGGGDGGGSAGTPWYASGVPLVTKSRVGSFSKVAVKLGGDGGATGDGGSVTVTQSGGLLSTRGDGATAILAQSVGGGGGKDIMPGGSGGSFGGSGTDPFTFVLGGDAGAGGSGGAIGVKLENKTEILTLGKAAYGIFAQSVGGGGGIGGTASLLASPVEIPGCDWCGKVSLGFGLALGGDGGAGGNGGEIAIIAPDAAIETHGAGSTAILAQSVGGGGGLAGQSAYSVLNGITYKIAGAYFGSGGASGSGGNVNVEFGGTILTTGEVSHGIFAESVGGGLAQGNGLTSVGGNIRINVTGKIDVRGQQSDGILADSDGATRAGNILISIEQGAEVSGGCYFCGGGVHRAFFGAGIEFLNGSGNGLVNAGTITSRDNFAIVARNETPNDPLTIRNSGRILGNILRLKSDGSMAASGTDDINVTNEVTGLIRATEIDLGSGMLQNDGTLLIDMANPTILVGGLHESSSSVVQLTLEPNAAAVTSGTAALAVSSASAALLSGKLVVNLTEAPSAGPHSVVLVTDSAGVQFDSLSAQSTSPSDVVRYQIRSAGEGVVSLDYSVDFASPAVLVPLNLNMRALAIYLQGVYTAGQLDGTLASQLIHTERTLYTAELNSLSAEIYVDNALSMVHSGLRFADDLRRCIGARERCAWGRVQGVHDAHDATADNLGYDSDGWIVSSGVQTVVGEDWHLGAAVGYDSGNLHSRSGATSRNDQFNIGALIGRGFGATDIYASLAGGYVRTEVRRAPLIGGGQRAPGATPHLSSLSGRLGVTYTFGTEGFHVRPRLELGSTRLHMPGIVEGGDNPFRLNTASSRETIGSLSPAVEMGGEFKTARGFRIRPRLVLSGIRYLGDAAASVTSSFASDTAGVVPFATRMALDRNVYGVTAGLDLLTRAGSVIRLEGFASDSSHMRSRGGSLKVEAAF